MKTLKKTVCLLLCLMLVVLSASACKITDGQDEATGGETSRTDDATHSSGEPTTEQTTDPIKPTEDIFPISALKETKIVYRTGASEAVTGYADQLAKTIESVFGVKPAVGNDFLREGSDTFREYDYEILLGKTNRDAGAELLASVREQDYGYTIYGNKILVWGGNEQALGKAVFSMIVSIMRQLVVLIPAAYVLAKFGGLHAVWWAFLTAEIMSLIVSLIFLFRTNRTIISKIPDGSDIL